MINLKRLLMLVLKPLIVVLLLLVVLLAFEEHHEERVDPKQNLPNQAKLKLQNVCHSHLRNCIAVCLWRSCSILLLLHIKRDPKTNGSSSVSASSNKAAEDTINWAYFLVLWFGC
ncbi:uncharacterized protein LOC130800144 [Amaranthus tricolor]|uniref:uncharacterized protein LOC130800144 n=1 Tax=Amaranthus tricolor TaxID=29722 RepID=UPI0025871F55|nr:uncharacterized protein LOC130800144 [Amaranthus tricolor]